MHKFGTAQYEIHKYAKRNFDHGKPDRAVFAKTAIGCTLYTERTGFSPDAACHHRSLQQVSE